MRLNLTLNFTRKWDSRLRIETEDFFFVKGSSRADKFWVDGVRYPCDLIGRYCGKVACNAYIHRHPPSYPHALIHSVFDKR